MSASTDTEHRILDGALTAIARFGSQKLSMVDLSRESGLSRGTLYRYFAAKEDVLAQLGRHLVESFTSGLDAAVATRPDLEDRVVVVTETVLGFVSRPEFSGMLDVDPNFVRTFFQEHFDGLVEPVARALAPAAENEHAQLPRLGPRTAAEVLVRLGLSFQFVRPDGQATIDAVHRILGRRGRETVLLPRQVRPQGVTRPAQRRLAAASDRTPATPVRH